MDYTLEELKALKKKWYNEAKASGIFTKLKFICRELGKNQHESLGPKYRFKDNGLSIHVDDHIDWLDVKYNNKIVCNPDRKLFVPGEWVELINDLYLKADAHNKRKKQEDEYNQIKKLTKELLLDE